MCWLLLVSLDWLHILLKPAHSGLLHACCQRVVVRFVCIIHSQYANPTGALSVFIWYSLKYSPTRSVINWDEIFITPLLQSGENLQFHEKFWATGSILSRQRICKSHGLIVKNQTKLAPERRNVIITDPTCAVNGCVWIFSKECKQNCFMCIRCGWTAVAYNLYDTYSEARLNSASWCFHEVHYGEIIPTHIGFIGEIWFLQIGKRTVRITGFLCQSKYCPFLC